MKILEQSGWLGAEEAVVELQFGSSHIVFGASSSFQLTWRKLKPERDILHIWKMQLGAGLSLRESPSHIWEIQINFKCFKCLLFSIVLYFELYLHFVNQTEVFSAYVLLPPNTIIPLLFVKLIIPFIEIYAYLKWQGHFGLPEKVITPKLTMEIFIWLFIYYLVS